MAKDFEYVSKELSADTVEFLREHKVRWELIESWHPNFNRYACYNKKGEFLYIEAFPKHINPNLTRPCGQQTIPGIVAEEHRDTMATYTPPVEREGFRNGPRL